MHRTPDDSLTALDRCLTCCERALRETVAPMQRAAAVAEALRELAPSAVGWGCRLEGDGPAATCVLDPTGARASTWPAGRAGAERWLLQDVTSPGRQHGQLALSLEDASDRKKGILPRLLSLCGRHLGLLLALEADSRAHREQLHLANLGTLASPVTHEFNNFLNVVLLQVAVLEQEALPQRRDEFAGIRQQGKGVAELVRQWQQYRGRYQPVAGPVDLDRTVREAVTALCQEEPRFGELALTLCPPAGAPAADTVAVRLDLGEGLPPVQGTTPDVESLVRFLIVNAAAAIPSAPGAVHVRTAQAEDRVLFRVEDTGPAVAAELLPHVFEPLTVARRGPNRLELAACKTLAQRRLQGSITAENRPEGGVAVSVLLRPWAPDMG